MYQKISAPRIFDGYHFRENHVLLLKRDGTVEALLPAAEAGEGVEMLEGILSPGFINCHCHLELSHMKGKIPEETGLVDFVWKVVSERGALEEEVLSAIDAAESAMIQGGIIAVGDICNNTSTLRQKQKGNLSYYNFIEASGWLPAGAPVRFGRAKAIYDAFLNNGGSTTPNPKPQTPNCSIVPHAPYSVSQELWQAIHPYFTGKVVSIHNQETRFEDELFLQGTGDLTRMYELMEIDNSHHRPTGQSSLQSYLQKLAGAENIILVHNTFTSEADLTYVKQETANVKDVGPKHPTPNAKPQTFFCLCVNANQYIERAMPPVEMMRKNGCTIVLGTDSLASNWSLSIADEITTIRQHFPHISLEEILGWATINGAKALGMEAFLGSFEKRKKPGVLMIHEQLESVTRIA
jgi:cytosine/adenosine deaminase-related metal-dependent hydrolase